MTAQVDLAAHARALLDTNLYLTLATVDPDGQPWISPVYFAAGGIREFYWVSATDARHSSNLAERPQVSLVVYDSSVPPYHGRALYAVADARELSGDDLERGLAVYPGPRSRGASRVAYEDVTGTARYRLYRAVASEVSVLCPREPRTPCPVHGLAEDHRVEVLSGGPVRPATSTVTGWLWAENLMPMYESLAALVGYSFDKYDRDAINVGIEEVDDRPDDRWFDYPLVGTTTLNVETAALARGSRQVRVHHDGGAVLDGRIDTLLTLLHEYRGLRRDS